VEDAELDTANGNGAAARYWIRPDAAGRLP
jgi:hypothetical protein